jgi:hypothetical protein
VESLAIEVTLARKTSTPFFAVTTSGRTASRWLSHVLAAHPEVFVAHGKFALDSVVGGDVCREKDSADVQALFVVDDLRSFYERRSLEEVLAAYQNAKPRTRAFGSVHSYTMHTLARAARRSATLDQIRVLNVVRHPVDLVASHYGLIRAAESQPRLNQYYHEQVFPRVLEEFPQLHDVRCPDNRAFVAFVLGCFTVNNLSYDLWYPGVRHLKMETLTTQVDALQEFCQYLTGLPYARETLNDSFAWGPSIKANARLRK